MALRIVVVSDTHGLHREVDIPEGDILVHAGDLTRHGLIDELPDFNNWLGELPHHYKLVIAGNHDWCFEESAELCASLLSNAIYLQDTGVTLEGLCFYGSPWTPQFYDWAFNLPRGAPLAEKWAAIPAGVDVLITHGPPRGQQDYTFQSVKAGCADLLQTVRRLRPRYHLFGHIHEAAGRSEAEGTIFINASVVDLRYQPVNPAVVFELAARAKL